MIVHENYQMCKVTNKKILDMLQGKIPEVTFACNKTESKCSFQFWVDQTESFYCGLENCEFDWDMEPTTNMTRYECKDIHCACVPDRMLCGEKGSIDITDFLTQTVKGPGFFKCDIAKSHCEFSEPSMNGLIKNVFGDPDITLSCNSSECLHYTEIPGYNAPKKELHTGQAIAAIAAASTILFLGCAALLFFKRQSDKDMIQYGALPESNDTFKLMTEHKPADFQFANVSYTDSKTERKILENIYGSVKPGEVLAIMGGSGAGKTTLLDILAYKTKRGLVTGDVYINGKTHVPSHAKRVIGFVDQENIMLPTLTVFETVVTSALLRLPKSMSVEAKRMRALETLSELGILGIKDQLIGSESTRGISGGEKRRVAIACELVTSPSILFLDEPTSGLDAYNAYNVIESITHLARDFNRTVVFSIHQPRSNIFALFDRLVLLSRGKLMYSGPASSVNSYFDSIGYPCPPGFNVADFVVDLTVNSTTGIADEDEQDDAEASGSSRTRRGSASGASRVRPARHSRVDVDRLRDLFNKSEIAATIRAEIEDSLENASEAAEGESLTNELYGYEKVGRLGQFTIVAGRTFKNLYRNPMLLLTHYVMAILIGVFCGLLYFNVSLDISGFQNRLGLFFFLLTLFGFSTLTTLSLFGDERIVFVRERSNGYYSSISYYLAKVLFDIIPLRVLPPILLGLIVYPLVGLSSEGSTFGKFLLILVLFNLTAASICLLIGILIRENAVASLVGILVMLFGILFAGLFLNQESMGAAAGWMRYLSIFHYAYEALIVNEVRYLTLTEKKYGLSIEVPGATILSTFGFDATAIWKDVIGLAGIFLLFLVAGFLAMHFLLIERR
jgi:ABC-type multidrug transport system ATPase subunit/ABC-type multidrug transport system permease subunit